MKNPEQKNYMDPVEKLIFIEGFFKEFGKGGGDAIGAKFTAQILASVQSSLQEGQFETRLEDWSIEEICDFVARSEAFK